jgi:hypothetical protein
MLIHPSARARCTPAHATASLREPRHCHGGAELQPDVERRGSDPRVPVRVHARRAVEPEDGGQVVRDGGGLSVEGQAAELGGRDGRDDVVGPEEQPRQQGRHEQEHRQVDGHRREARGRALVSPLRAAAGACRCRQRMLNGHGAQGREGKHDVRKMVGVLILCGWSGSQSKFVALVLERIDHHHKRQKEQTMHKCRRVIK